MPRRPPGRVRADLARPRPTPILGAPLSTSRALDRLDRRALGSRHLSTELATWRHVAHLPASTLRRENNDWTQLIGPAARTTLEEGMRALSARRGAALRAVVGRLDALFAAKTLPDPTADPALPWWGRRC